MMLIIDGSFPPHNTESRINGIGDSNSCAGCTPMRMKTAVLLPLSVSASESGSQSRSLSVSVARHDLSGSITIADCGCDADTASDPDGLLS